jgi:hypothetical protein
MPSSAWQTNGERLTACFDLQRGVQVIKIY